MLPRPLLLIIQVCILSLMCHRSCSHRRGGFSGNFVGVDTNTAPLWPLAFGKVPDQHWMDLSSLELEYLVVPTDLVTRTFWIFWGYLNRILIRSERKSFCWGCVPTNKNCPLWPFAVSLCTSVVVPWFGHMRRSLLILSIRQTPLQEKLAGVKSVDSAVSERTSDHTRKWRKSLKHLSIDHVTGDVRMTRDQPGRYCCCFK